MKRVVIMTSILFPYRVDLFDYLQRYTNECEIHILYTSRNKENRSRKIEREKMQNSYFLES